MLKLVSQYEQKRQRGYGREIDVLEIQGLNIL